jgi:hypothetical protein
MALSEQRRFTIWGAIDTTIYVRTGEETRRKWSAAYLQVVW